MAPEKRRASSELIRPFEERKPAVMEAPPVESLNNGDNKKAGSDAFEKVIRANLKSWGSIAQYWDTTVAEGNDMYRDLVLPAMKELVDLKPREKVLDVATGNGIIARQMASLGGVVTATDGCIPLLEIAKERSIAE